jgi:hypothetical protein
MVECITRGLIRQNAGPITEQAAVLKKVQDRSPAGSTFHSHSSKDTDLLPGVIGIIERHGAAVYVDKKDEAFSPFTSRETATILRGRIRQSRKFILFYREQ